MKIRNSYGFSTNYSSMNENYEDLWDGYSYHKNVSHKLDLIILKYQQITASALRKHSKKKEKLNYFCTISILLNTLDAIEL